MTKAVRTEPGEPRRSTADPVVIHAGQPRALEAYLHEQGWLDDGEVVEQVEAAGPGNMNLVLRVVTPSRSMIVKQARPFVERYPHIAAPLGRALTEAEWYGLAGKVPELAGRLPLLLGVDPVNHALVLSDLGPAADLAGVYAGSCLGAATLSSLITWLALLHGSFRNDDAAAKVENREMRQLNHEHLFEVPLRADDGLDLDALTPGLAGLARALRADPLLLRSTAALGSAYLGPGKTLIHGDFYPGSWLAGPGGPFIIDPEFGFFGLPEIDAGVMLAHLELSGHPEDVVARALEDYLAAAELDAELAWAFCGVEVIRRLLGVAQLPLAAGLAEKASLLDRARERMRAVG